MAPLKFVRRHGGETAILDSLNGPKRRSLRENLCIISGTVDGLVFRQFSRGKFEKIRVLAVLLFSATCWNALKLL